MINIKDMKGKRLKNKKKINNNENKVNTAKQLKRKKIIKITIIILLILAMLFIGISLAINAFKWKNLATDMFANENSVVLDIDGNIIAEIGSERKKNKIEFEDIPDNLKNAYVAIEDERFYSHHGVDIKRTGSAILSYIFHFGSSSYGGSTITQQLVKNLTGDNTDSVFRKVREWWKAYLLESYFSKNEILEMYLNVIYVGPNIYGVQTGSRYYFNKDATDLSLAESAFLAGINNSPNSYNPFGDTDNSEKINNRTKIVLSKMLELEYINQNEYDQAVSEVENGLNFKNGNIESNDGIYSYHTDALINEIIEDLSNNENISETFAQNYLYLSGSKIYSTQDSTIQKATENEFEKSRYKIKSVNGNDYSQAAMVIIDHTNGQVLSCVGGLGEKDTARGLNRATQSIRQTGSAIKPIAVLAPALDRKIITLASIYDDTQKTFKDNYSPVNYDGYLGKISVRRAIESSQNIPFVEIMEELTPKKSISYLEKMGITTLTDNDNNLALALGGLEKGISPLEMAAAYATIANDGEYIEPTFYIQIVNKSGKVVVEPEQESRKVFSESVAYVLKKGLTQPVLGNNGTARYCSISNMDVAAKTGTTDDNFDRWLCGFTPYYTAVTWFGYDQNETVNFNNQNPAGLIWANVMKSIHSKLASKQFERPDGVVEATICSETGLKANSGCPDTYIEYFIKGTIPSVCKSHRGTEIKSNNYNSDEEDKKILQNMQNDNSTESNLTQNEIIDDNSSENQIETNEINNNTSSNNIIHNDTNNNINNSNTNTNTNTSMNNTNTTNSINTNSSTNTNTNNNVNQNTNISTNTNVNTNSNISSNSNVVNTTNSQNVNVNQ